MYRTAHVSVPNIETVATYLCISHIFLSFIISIIIVYSFSDVMPSCSIYTSISSAVVYHFNMQLLVVHAHIVRSTNYLSSLR